MKLSVGLDVLLVKTSICVISEYDKIIKEAEAESAPEVLSRRLIEARLDVVVMETRLVKGALKAMPIKTDRRDTEGIARLLHLGWFRPVHCKSVSAQEPRAVLCARKAIQQNMIALEMSLHGLLWNFGLKVGAISRGRFETRIRALADGKPMLITATEPMLRA